MRQLCIIHRTGHEQDAEDEDCTDDDDDGDDDDNDDDDDKDDDDDDDEEEELGGWSPDEAYLRPAPRPSPHFSNADYTVLGILYTV